MELCARGNSETICNENLKGVGKLIKIPVIWVLKTAIQITIQYLASSVVNLEISQNGKAPSFRSTSLRWISSHSIFLVQLVAVETFLERARSHVASTWGAAALIRHLRGLL